MKKQLELILVFIIFSNTIFCGSNREIVESNRELPVITMAYSWEYGFKNNLKEFSDSVKNDFIIKTEENLGLNHKEKILIDASSNSVPDVFCFWSYETNLRYLADNGFLLNMDEYLQASTKYSREDFIPRFLDATKVDGINYALPHESFYGFMALNQSIFDEYNLDIPKTFSDLKEISPILNKNGITPFSMGSFRGDPGHLFFSALSYQDPNGYRDAKDMKLNNKFKNPGTLKAADAILELRKNRVIPNNTIYEGSFDRQVDLYNNRKAAMIFAFTWSLARFNDDVAKDTVIIPIPRISDESIDTRNFTIGGVSQSICISKKAWSDLSKRGAIIKLIDWIFSDEVFNARYRESGSFPAKKMDINIIDKPIYIKSANYIKNSEIYDLHEFYFNSLGAFNQFKEANDLLWSGALSRDEFMDMVQNVMGRVVEKN